MALGELLYEERGKQTSTRTVMEAEEPLTEVTGTGNMKLKDMDVTTNWTLQVAFGNNGIGYSQGKGSMYIDNKEVASYAMSSITKPNSPDIASSRGISRIRCSSSYDNPEISSLLDGTAVVYNWNRIMMGIIQQNSGNGSNILCPKMSQSPKRRLWFRHSRRESRFEEWQK
jgi:hypothetical protein